MPRIWIEEEREILKKLAEKGYRTAEIMTVLKSRSRCSIDKEARLLGISLAGPKPIIDHKALDRLLNQEVEDA